ncbi:putative polyketide synthase [Xylariaceae sp. FL1019]|nr:putative polyketide synthase [Xylariaceae sp. FL1019]
MSSENHDAPRFEPIAIIGMAMRLPGKVRSGEDYWRLLSGKESALCEVPKDRFNSNGFFDGTGRSRSIPTSKGYFLEDVDIREFDASVFPIPKKELERLDPSQRQLLQVAYECLENAGVAAWRGRNFGCYIGCFGEDWQDLNAKETQHLGGYRATGYGDFTLANRISYEFDLRGPSMTVKTACSSSLVCLDLACAAIQNGECDGALVGGVSLIFSPTMWLALHDQGLLSPTGQCWTFDASADGYARGEAVNMIFVKKAADAIRDNDPIRAIIRAQATLIKHTYAAAGIVDLSETALIEMHGTGTQVGDPLEAEAVAHCFGDKGIVITSVKPNIGHSEGAAGLSSLIKCVLTLERRSIPPNRNFMIPNPKIPFDQYKLHVPTEVESWPEGRAERVSVNSFGIGGVNAHVILESLFQFGMPASPLTNGTCLRTQLSSLLLFSAYSLPSLREQIIATEKYVRANTTSLQDLAYTLSNRREHRSYRAYAQAEEASPWTVSPIQSIPESPPRVGWIFTGQGAQWPRMGAELLDKNPTFRDSIRNLDRILLKFPTPPSWTIEDELRKDASASRVHKAEMGHPLTLAIQIGLVDVLRSWGVTPSFVLGHSSGEMAAAYASGALTAESAMSAGLFRSAFQESTSRQGSMAAVGLGREEVLRHLKAGVVIACENSQCSVTLSGDSDQLSEVIQSIESDSPGTFTRFLRVEKAFHSYHMLEHGSLYEEHLRPYFPELIADPQIPFYSSVTGDKLSGIGRLGPSYWRNNMENPVLFNSAFRSVLRDEHEHLLMIEIGPHPALGGPIRQILSDLERGDIHTATLSRGSGCHESLLHLAGKLFQNNVNFGFSEYFPLGKHVQDLPAYAWERDVTHWAESRVSHEWRHRDYPHHELLGSRIVENGSEPCWRNVLRLDDAPWLNGHEVSGRIVFPAAGYIAMIGEAIRQLDSHTSYAVRDVRITSATMLETDRSTELITSLKAVVTDASERSSWYMFTISSHDGTRWTTNCTGEARAWTDKSIPVRPSMLTQEALPRRVDDCTWYKLLSQVGFNYTGAFRGLRCIRSATTASKATAIVLKSCDDERRAEKYSLHPSTIDKCLQVFTVAAYRGLGRNMSRGAVPTFIEEMVISATTSDLEVTAEVSVLNRGSFTGDLIAQNTGHTCLHLKGCKASVLTDDHRVENDRFITHFQWQPSSDFTDLGRCMHPQTDGLREWPLLEELVTLCVLDHQQKVQWRDTSPSYLKHFANWMNAHTEKYLSGRNTFLSGDLHLDRLECSERLARIEDIVTELSDSSYSVFSIAIYRLFLSAQSIFSAEILPLSILMKEDLLSQIYVAANALNFEAAFRLIGNTHPRLRVLEVGAGTGGTTAKALAALKSSYGERLYSSYTYTDVSSGFFDAAKRRFEDYCIEYAVLDITKQPTQQGFQLESYDLVICSNVLHATPSLQICLGHVHSLLSEGGKIFLEELCPESKFIDYIYGFLPGWWSGVEEGRVQQPYISPEQWTGELLRAGYQPPEAVVFDRHAPYHLSAGILASRKSATQLPRRVTLLCHTTETPLVQDLKECLELHHIAVDICLLGQALLVDQDCISLLDLQTPIFHELSDEIFNAVMGYIRSHKARILWVMPLSQIDCPDPRVALTLGFARTTRNELSIQLLTVEIDVATSYPVAAEAVMKILCAANIPQSSSLDHEPDFEYAIIEGVILIPRLHWQSPEEITARSQSAAKSTTKLRRLDVKIPGLLKSMTWVEEEIPPIPDNGDVLIALNVLDDSTAEMGLEGSGVIKAVGSTVHHLSVGDRVMYMSSGCFTTHLVVSAALCVKMDDSMSFEISAAIPCVYATALLALVDKANLRRGQSILIHSAAGGVGTAAIQLAKMVGADIYCTAGSKSKIEYLINSYGLDRSHIFNSRDSSFLPAVMQATNGRGVDVVLNSLSGELLHASWKCVAEFGTMVEIGKRDFRRRAKLSMESFEQNRTFVGLDLWQISRTRPKQAAELVERCLNLIQNGALRGPTIAGTYEATNIQTAFSTMQTANHIGKIIITMPTEKHLLEAHVTKPTTSLRPDRSYLLVGGLGGLGRAVATWMIEQGARELIFFSRSARRDDGTESFVEELLSQDCEVHLVQGSVSEALDVQKAVSSGTRPLAGIINMAMVLKDVALSEMTLSDWNVVVEPKVQGTWNLHNAAPAYLDFFVLFSSFSGIVGHWGQANYAAANTFLDAFVRYRQRLGLAASVIDIGVMGDVGVVSYNSELRRSFERTGIRIMQEQHLLDVLALAMMNSKLSPEQRQQDGAFEELGHLSMGITTSTPMSSVSTRVAWKRDARMAICYNLDNQVTETSGSKTTSRRLLKVQLTSEDTHEGKTKMVAAAMAAALANFLIKDVANIALDIPLEAIGMDSLVAIEIRNWIRQQTGVECSVFTITQASSLLSLGECVLHEMKTNAVSA